MFLNSRVCRPLTFLFVVWHHIIPDAFVCAKSSLPPSCFVWICVVGVSFGTITKGMVYPTHDLVYVFGFVSRGVCHPLTSMCGNLPPLLCRKCWCVPRRACGSLHVALFLYCAIPFFQLFRRGDFSSSRHVRIKAKGQLFLPRPSFDVSLRQTFEC